jgi:hypothetical protein
VIKVIEKFILNEKLLLFEKRISLIFTVVVEIIFILCEINYGVISEVCDGFVYIDNSFTTNVLMYFLLMLRCIATILTLVIVVAGERRKTRAENRPLSDVRKAE